MQHLYNRQHENVARKIFECCLRSNTAIFMIIEYWQKENVDGILGNIVAKHFFDKVDKAGLSLL